MATPDKVGAGNKFAIVGGSGKTWGTAQLALTTGAGCRPLSFSGSDNPAEIDDKGYNADIYQRQSALAGRRAPSFEIELDATYEGVFATMCALLMGADATSGAPSTYLHTLTRIVDAAGIMGTMVWYDSSMAHEFDSFKVVEGTFTGTPGEPLKGKFKCEAHTRTENATSPVANGTASIGNLTETGSLVRAQWIPSVFSAKIIAQGGTLAAFEINNFEVTFGHPVETGDGLYSSATISGGTLRREMNRIRAKSGFKFAVPMQSTAYLAACLAATIYDVEIAYAVSTVPIIRFAFPSWKATKADLGKLTGMGMLQQSLEGPLEVPVTAPAGMTVTTVSPSIQITNSVAAAYV